MLRDRHELDNFFIDIATQASEMEPVLVQIDSILDDEALYQMVRADMSQRSAHTIETGRPATPVEVVLRMLAVKHLYNLSYEQTERQVCDSLVLRQFCRVYFHDVPDDTTLIRWANQIQPETLVAFNQQLSQMAYQLKVTRGRKLGGPSGRRWNGSRDLYRLSQRQQAAGGWCPCHQSHAETAEGTALASDRPGGHAFSRPDT